jgi:hypothetical protein
MKTLISSIACAVILAACHTSPKPQAIPQATSPYGVRGTVTLAYGRTYEGELLAVTDTSVVMFIDGRVGSVRPAAIIKLTVPGAGDIDYKAGRAVSAKRLARARQLARFPYGMSAEVTAELLAKSSQASPDDLEAKSQ